MTICKRYRPIVPEAMTEKLVAKYVQLRKEARNNADTTFTSPRVLLALLRMSTALVGVEL